MPTFNTCRLSSSQWAKLVISVFIAAAAWFYMFSPWTMGLTNFWITMACAGVVLVSFSLLWGNGWQEDSHGCRVVQQLLLGVAIAAVLWGLFWVGDKVSSWMFDFARPQVDGIYGMKVGLSPQVITLLLLLIIGPAEELFWRGYVQRTLCSVMGRWAGFVVATLTYMLIHVWSFNFMLIMSALVCGVIWGGLYMLRPKWLPALVISHAVWDACVFVVFPF